MSNQEYYLTEEGAAKLRAELEELKGPRRSELAQRLREAIQQGDLSENADYSKAKEDQAFLEGRIQEVEALLGRANIITNSRSADGVIGVGSVVVIKEPGRGPAKYFLVGAQEADPRNGKISNESPIGKALLGHKAGETVTAETPAGPLVFEIIEVE
ncbi:MAG: transcription elongation factor GreA [Anaerolineales bacterium]|nr:transcription elongation factor GreA [Anaerolineales bacterium]